MDLDSLLCGAACLSLLFCEMPRGLSSHCCGVVGMVSSPMTKLSEGVFLGFTFCGLASSFFTHVMWTLTPSVVTLSDSLVMWTWTPCSCGRGLPCHVKLDSLDMWTWTPLIVIWSWTPLSYGIGLPCHVHLDSLVVWSCILLLHV